jgi:uncharacterized membrane protein YfcA
VKIANLSSNVGSLIVFLINGQTILPLGLIAAVFSIAGHFLGVACCSKTAQKLSSRSFSSCWDCCLSG